VIALSDIEAARKRIAGAAVRTPLVRLYADDARAEVYLKLELLQPIGSFKIRGATNAIRLAPPERVQQGLVTASAGNMAQGVAWAARELGVQRRSPSPSTRRRRSSRRSPGWAAGC
jgi:threonine dehydratase